MQVRRSIRRNFRRSRAATIAHEPLVPSRVLRELARSIWRIDTLNISEPRPGPTFDGLQPACQSPAKILLIASSLPAQRGGNGVGSTLGVLAQKCRRALGHFAHPFAGEICAHRAQKFEK